jgi:poly-gamma-glutamate capsule biosynthesis protein CapA/YwtB (metallophosphatase superfamily)
MSRRAIAFVLATLLVVALGLLAADRVARSTRAPAPTPPIAAIAPATPCTAMPHPSATPTTAPSATPSPTVTPRPLRLGVDQPTYARFRDALLALPERLPGWALVPYPTTYDAERLLADGLADAALTWAADPPPGATLLRAEPYAAAFHVTYPEREVSLDRLAALARGEDPHRTLVVAPGGREAVRHLLGVKPGDALELADWESAKEYVAIHPEAWALLPWEAIDFRVRALPVDGARPDPRDGDGSPLVRRLWLLAARGDVQPLEGALIAALRYELPPVVELVAVGDIMLGRTVGRLIAGDSVRYPFEGEGILPILQGADVAFGNLECPISDRGSPVSKTYTFRADPAAVEGLVWAGMDVLSLANNHLGDYGVDAVYDTLRHLAESGLGVTGAGETEDAAHAPHIVEVGELRLAFLAFNQIHPKTFAATGALPGLAWMEMELMTAAVRAARRLADVVIISCHWGIEYSAYPTADQMRISQALADAGADLVIGHHPHVVQGVHYHTETFTVYSLGNFIFDIDLTAESLQGAMLRCLLDATGVKTVEMIPVAIVGCRPEIMPPEHAETVLARMERVTRESRGLPAPR